MDSRKERDRADSIRALFDEVVGIEPNQRALRLEEACGGDLALRRDVESLLEAFAAGKTDMDLAMADLSSGSRPGIPESDVSRDRLASAFGDRYRIEDEVGRGGMATVYKARDLKHHRDVAVKVLRPALAAAIGPDRFNREIETTARLDHPHIIPLLDSGEAGGALYYVMPYVTGQSLRQKLRGEKQLSLEEVANITGQVADALTHAHSQNIVHRDIKPENIMLSDGHARVADFGIAKAVSQHPDSAGTETGLAVGTPAYMSPEQASGDRSVDGRSDTYSLACVAYEMLTGEPPHTGATREAILARKTLGKIPSVKTVRPSVPTGVERVLQKALRAAPADRFDTTREFAAALEGTLADSSGVDWRQRRVRQMAYGGLASILLISVAWLARTQLGSRPEPIDSLAVLPCENLSEDPNLDYFVDGMRTVLSDRLARLTGIERVTSRASVLSISSRNASGREIGRALDVKALVECAVLLSATEVQITVDLIDAEVDRRIWGASYRRSLEDVVVLQNEIARDVASEMSVILTPADREGLASRTTVDPQVTQLVLRGDYQILGMTDDAFRRAARSYEQAIELDPTYAPAYAGLAMAHTQIGQWHGAGTPSNEFLKAGAAAEEALRLDPTLAEAHAALGQVRGTFDWDWEGAEEAFQAGIRLGPRTPWAVINYANFLTAMGRFDEAVDLYSQNVGGDPLTPTSHLELGWALDFAGRHTEALAAYRRVLDLDPHFLQAHILLAYFHQEQGDTIQALVHQAEIEARADELSPRQLSWLGFIYGAAGHRERAREILTELHGMRRESYVPAGAIADVYLGLGSHDEALTWLETAYEERDVFMPWLKEAWWYDPLREDPRFRALIDRMNFPE